MSEPRKIILSFKNAINLCLPKRVSEELEGREIEVWPGYPYSDEPIFLLGRLVSSFSPEGQAVINSYPVVKQTLLNFLEENNLNFSRKWIEKNIPGYYIRIEKDCVKQ